LDRIELKTKLTNDDALPVRALGLIGELTIDDNTEFDGLLVDDRVLSIAADEMSANFVHKTWDLVRVKQPVALNVGWAAEVGMDLYDSLADGMRKLRCPKFVEVNHIELRKDAAQFAVLNLCESWGAGIQLRVSDYAPGWQDEVSHMLREFAGFIAALGVPQPMFTRNSDAKTANSLAFSVQNFIRSIPEPSEVSALCFDSSSVNATGMLCRQRYWFGL
jgi:hypothetical protein